LKRWITLAARIGTVFIAISLALCLVSLIPIGTVNEEKNELTLLPETFAIHYTVPYLYFLNPQIGVWMTLESNGTLNLKLFNLHYNNVSDWLYQHSPTHNWTTTLLEEFTTAHSAYLTLEQSVLNGTTIFEYVPPKMENATVILSNPTSAVVHLSYENKTIKVVASPGRVFLALIITAPLGILFTVPRIVLALREKRKTKKTNTPTAA